MATPIANMTATWANSSVVYTGISMNVNSQARATGSRLYGITTTDQSHYTSAVISGSSTIHYVGATANTSNNPYAESYYVGPMPNQGFEVGTQKIGTNGEGTYHYLYGTGNYPIDFYANAAFAMRISPTGNVGIGTSSPNAKFSIGNTINFYDSQPPAAQDFVKKAALFHGRLTSGLYLSETTDVGDGGILDMCINVPQLGNKSNNFYSGIVRLDTRPAEKSFNVRGNTDNINLPAHFTVKLDTGFVGIGNSSPIYPLDIISGNNVSGAIALRILTQKVPTASNGALIVVGSTHAPDAADERLGGFAIGGGNPTGYLYTTGITGWSQEAFGASSAASYLRFETTNFGATGRSEKMRITANGDVGIGTNPERKLEIRGTLTDDANSELRLSGRGWLDFWDSTVAGAYNPRVQTGDRAIIYSNSSGTTDGSLFIGPWSLSSRGMRFDSTGRIDFFGGKNLFTSDGSVGGPAYLGTKNGLNIYSHDGDTHLYMHASGQNIGGLAVDSAGVYLCTETTRDIIFKYGITNTGDFTATGTEIARFTSGSLLQFSNTVGSAGEANKIRLYSSTYGFGISSGVLNYLCDANGSHHFYCGGSNPRFQITNSLVHVRRQNTTSEGGEIGLSRPGDDTIYWVIDCVGNTWSPYLRIFCASGAPHFAVSEVDGSIWALGSYNATGAGSDVVITSSGQFIRNSSSIKYKTQVEDLDISLVDNAIDNLRPVWYRSKDPKGDDKAEWSHIGLIAEEVDLIEKRLVKYRTVDVSIVQKEVLDEKGNVFLDENGTPKTKPYEVRTIKENPEPEDVNYARLSVILLSAVKRQKQQLEDAFSRIEQLEKNIKKMTTINLTEEIATNTENVAVETSNTDIGLE